MIINNIRLIIMRFVTLLFFGFISACGAGQGQSYRIHVDRATQTASIPTPKPKAAIKEEPLPVITHTIEQHSLPALHMPHSAILPSALHAPTMLRAILSPDPSQSVPQNLQDVYDNVQALSRQEQRILYNAYMNVDFNPLWLENGAVSKKAVTVRTFLNREIYLSTPHKLIDIRTLQGKKQTDFVRYDLNFTISLIKKAQIIKNGISALDGLYGVTEGVVPFNLNWDIIFGHLDHGNIHDFKKYIRPSHPFYLDMISEMDRVARLSHDGQMIHSSRIMKQGMSGSDIEQLIIKLKREGYLDKNYQTMTYDHMVADAVRQFQLSSGASADGHVGPQTLKMLNRSRNDFIRMLLVNFERIRKAPRLASSTKIRVNVPEYRARYFENDVQTMDMSVIVGREERPTPIFYDQMSYIEFNPYWNVPHRLAVEDILPKVQRNKSYISEKNFYIYHGNKRVKASAVNWKGLNKHNFKYRFRQQPGPQNALGTVKFMFPNKYAVYLHDTPAKSLFHRINKSQSSGCVRVSDPVTLASKLLKNRMSRAEVKAIFRAKKNKQVKIYPRVDIALEYLTVSPMDTGKIRYNQDIYDLDDHLFSEIRNAILEYKL